MPVSIKISTFRRSLKLRKGMGEFRLLCGGGGVFVEFKGLAKFVEFLFAEFRVFIEFWAFVFVEFRAFDKFIVFAFVEFMAFAEFKAFAFVLA